MLLASYLLAGLAIVLAWPVPLALARSSWPSRAPAAAMIFWQGIALAGGLSMIGSFLSWGLQPLGEGFVPAGLALAGAILRADELPGLDVVHLFALSLAALLTGHLVLTLGRSAWRLGRQRQRHREMLAFLSRPEAGPGTAVIDSDTPLAYCLPGATQLTVLSSGLLRSLSPRELDAVLAHESAHLEQRHDLLLLAFTSWHAALPWLPTTRLAVRAVGELVEELADDAALRRSGRAELLGALAVVAAAALPDDAGRGSAPAPPAAPTASEAAASPAVPAEASRAGLLRAAAGSPHEGLSSARLARLLQATEPLAPWARRGVGAAGAALVVLPTVLLAGAGWGF